MYDYLVAKAEKMMSDGEFGDEVLHYLNMAIALNQTRPTAYYCLAKYYQSLNEHQKVFENYGLAIERIDGSTIDGWRLKGTLVKESAEYEKCVLAQEFPSVIRGFSSPIGYSHMAEVTGSQGSQTLSSSQSSNTFTFG